MVHMGTSAALCSSSQHSQTGIRPFAPCGKVLWLTFLGQDPNFPNDNGFALKHGRKVECQNAAIFRDGNTATSVGNFIITDKSGKVTVVDKTWTFFKAADGKLRIVVHHSSLPYEPRVGSVSKAEVEAAQKAWGDALVNVSRAYDEKGFEAAKTVSERLIDELYGYQIGPVLFKPTLAYGSTTFRTIREGALAYFIGRNANYPTDTGFALKHRSRPRMLRSASTRTAAPLLAKCSSPM